MSPDGIRSQRRGVNLRGFFEVSRAAVAAMLSRDGGGHIVNISTSLVDHATSAVPSALASLTKGGLNAVTKRWRSNMPAAVSAVTLSPSG